MTERMSVREQFEQEHKQRKEMNEAVKNMKFESVKFSRYPIYNDPYFKSFVGYWDSIDFQLPEEFYQRFEFFGRKVVITGITVSHRSAKGEVEFQMDSNFGMIEFPEFAGETIALTVLNTIIKLENEETLTGDTELDYKFSDKIKNQCGWLNHMFKRQQKSNKKDV